ncbi:MAG: hypothetical protein OHK0039_19650 [Bacteroidia bacterium]
MIGLLVCCTDMVGQVRWRQQRLPAGLDLTTLACDAQGFIWGGATGGRVARFDGYAWDIATLPDTGSIAVLAVGPDGSLWAGSETGQVFCWRIGVWSPVPLLRAQHPVRALGFDTTGGVWVGFYGGGVSRYDGTTVLHWGLDEGLPSNDIYALAGGSGSEIWAGTDQGIARCVLAEGCAEVVRVGRAGGLPDELVMALSRSSRGDLWVGMYDAGLMVYRETAVGAAMPPRWSGHVAQVVGVQDDTGWIVDQQGDLWRVLPDTSFRVVTPAAVRACVADRHRGLWMLTQNGRLYQGQGAMYLLRRAAPAVGDTLLPIQALAVDTRLDCWAGTRAGLFRLTAAGWERVVPGLHVSALYVDEMQHIWIGTLGQGVWHYNTAAALLQPMASPGFPRRVPVLSIAGTGRHVWIGTFGGAYHCTGPEALPAADAALRCEPDTRMRYVYQALADARGRFCFATDGQGLVEWDEHAGISAPEALQGATLYALAPDADSGLWILGATGHVIYRQGAAFDTLAQLTDQAVLSVIPTRPGEALVASEAGLYQIARDRLLLLPLLAAGQWSDMGRNLHVHARDALGRVWIGTAQELLCIDTRYLPQADAPIPHLKGIRVNLLPGDTARHVFSFRENHLTFAYTGLWHTDPDRLSYRYRLHGRDLGWVPSRDPQAIYSDLSPGDYRFELQVGIDGHFAGDATRIWAFRVRKPFWQTAWFIVLATGSGLLAALYLGWLREQRLRRAQALLKQNIEYQFDTLRSQINPHFLFNTLATLSGLIEESPDRAVRYVDRLSDMFRHVLAYRETPLIALAEELRLLDNYYALQQERYGKHFRLDVQVDAAAHALLVPPMVLQILVENTLKHNIATLRRPLHVVIYTDAKDYLWVRNNLQRRPAPANSTHTGIANIRARYRLLTERAVAVVETEETFEVGLPLIHPASHEYPDHRR